jgi:prolyl-tRNA editing enzyme YbaK/EbsC (Cys-tRNA(Pro) deacylase)
VGAGITKALVAAAAGRTAKGIVRVDDRLSVNAARRLSGAALLDYARIAVVNRS